MRQVRDEIKLGFFALCGLGFSILIFSTTFIYIKESYSIPQKQGVIQEKFIKKIIKQEYKLQPIPPTKKPRVAIIIDDCGFNINSNLKKLLNLQIPLNFAVIPGFKYSKKTALLAYKYGHEVLIHMPMQSSHKNNLSAYKIKILTNMPESDISKNIEAAISEISGARGMNNHEGSIATKDINTMKAVLNKIKELNLYFVDSLTTSESIVYKTAKKLGVPSIRNNIFLDPLINNRINNNITIIEGQIKKLVALAKKRGYAVAIGHLPNNNTIKALYKLCGYIKTHVDPVNISDLLTQIRQ